SVVFPVERIYPGRRVRHFVQLTGRKYASHRLPCFRNQQLVVRVGLNHLQVSAECILALNPTWPDCIELTKSRIKLPERVGFIFRLRLGFWSIRARLFRHVSSLLLTRYWFIGGSIGRFIGRFYYIRRGTTFPM